MFVFNGKNEATVELNV